MGYTNDAGPQWQTVSEIPAGRPLWVGGLTRVAIAAGVLVVLGLSASSAITGYFHLETAKERTRRELQLAEARERDAVAENYLRLILARDTPEDSRANLYSALAQLKGHPSQPWAQERFADYRHAQATLKQALDEKAAAARSSSQEADGRVHGFSADIEALNGQITAATDAGVRDGLQKQRVEKSRELALAVAARNLAKIAESEQLAKTAAGPIANDSAVRIEALTQRVDATLLKPMFPAAAAPNIDANAPYLRAALQEYGVGNPKFIAALIATIAVETPQFVSYEEPESAGMPNEGRRDIGNSQPGDGVKFRGRGYTNLTGRANYQGVSEQLGLGSRLVDSPGDVKSPEVASRVLVGWFMERRAGFAAALDHDDLATVRRQISGAPTQLPRFEAVYRQALQALGR